MEHKANKHKTARGSDMRDAAAPEDAGGSVNPTFADDDGATLRMRDQLLEDWVNPAYWRRVCPFLSVARDSHRQRRESSGKSDHDHQLPELCKARDLSEGAKNALHCSLRSDGFVSLSAETLEPLFGRIDDCEADDAAHGCEGAGPRPAASCAAADGLVYRLARGVARLVALGHSPSSICVYDEHWELLRRLQPLLHDVTGNKESGDVFAFHRSADPVHAAANTSDFGSTPHRDRPNAGPNSFREDGSAM